ncbi:MAG TPA: TonB-dependent receptor [Casimicrobiaceae bacterium]|nr:TonB-dependent receptor [Casimicrobiaceae bacterium]
MRSKIAMGMAFVLASAAACAQQSDQPAPAQVAAGPDAQVLAPIQVSGHYDNSVGSSDAASEGVITPQLIEDRPLLRPGNILDYVPGMVVTQHSGAGKANQYFLRGFNLDHGTDFSTWVAGMPVNLRTHAHGQGYTDLNFIIPELISRVDYWKGPYYANIGDFSSAGGAYIHYYDEVKQGVALGTGGDYGYARALLVGSTPTGPGMLTYGLEALHNNGPWENPDNYRKYNAVLRYVMPAGEGTVALTAMAYQGMWNSTDQIPMRAVDEGLIGRYGAIDPSDGGESQRYSFSVDYATPLAGGQFQTTAYWFKYRLNLFSNFTFYLDDPVNGDQFEQADDRNVFGWTGSWTKAAELFGTPTRNTLGYEFRQDRIDPVGLYATRQRERLSVTRQDDVVESSAGVYAENDTQWNDWLRSVLGLRYDWYRFNVDSDNPENSGNVTSGIVSPKASLIFGPWYKTEYFLNAGYGFHSNDARGVTAKVDPKTGDSVDPATPLVRSKGAEVGARTEAIPNVQSSLALWYLTLGSELVFEGDAGTTDIGRPSQRYGVEWNTRWRPLPYLFVDLDVAWNHAQFTDDAPEGNYIPGAPNSVVSAGVAIDKYGPWSAALFLTYIGSYPLIEDNSVRSSPSTVVDAQLGYQITSSTKVRLDVFNLFNAQTNDIEYYYTSRLPGEPPEGVNDVHFHPGEKRSFRVTLSYNF